jgi:hypothetical protein
MDMDETKVPAPKNPLTVKLNQFIFRTFREIFWRQFLPTLDPIITSAYRTMERNTQVGGAVNSAHVHGLAEDWQMRQKNGVTLPEAQAKAIFEKLIKPNWPGYAYWEPSSPGEGYHVHAQLSREITTYAGLISMAGIGALGFAIINNWGKES